MSLESNQVKDVEFYLRQYRKAILTDRKRVVRQSLQRLVELDRADNWGEVLEQAEEDLQEEMGQEYRAAKRGGQEERARELEDEFYSIEWAKAPACSAAKELIEVCRKRKEEAAEIAAAERARKQQEAQEREQQKAREEEETARKKAVEEKIARLKREAEESRVKRNAQTKNLLLGMVVVLVLLGVALYAALSIVRSRAEERMRQSEAKKQYFIDQENKYREHEEAVAKGLAELNQLKTQSYWWEDLNSITGKISQLAALSNGRDEIDIKLSNFSNDWRNAKETCQLHLKTHDEFYAQLTNLNVKLATELTDSNEKLQNDFLSCRRMWTDLKKAYEVDHLKLSEEDLKADTEFKTLCAKQDRIYKIFDAMRETHDVARYIELRNELKDKFGSFQFAKHIAALPYSAARAQEWVAGKAPEQLYYKRFAKEIEPAAFKAFLDSKVLPLASNIQETALYGIWQPVATNNPYRVFVGLSQGQAAMHLISGAYSIEGDLYDFENKPCARARIWRPSNVPLETELLGSMEEMKDLIQFAGRGKTAALDFEQKLIHLIDEHIQSSSSASDSKIYPFYRHVQMLSRYLTWLKDDLKVLPRMPLFLDAAQDAAKLAAPLHIEGLPDEISWAALYDSTIQEHNRLCYDFLLRLHSKGFIKQYNAARRLYVQAARRANWKVKYVGNLNCPSVAQWRKAPTKFYLSIFDEQAKGQYPLYVLREENAKLVFKRVLEWNEMSRTMRLTNGMGKKLLAGDPLFQIVEDDKTIDLEHDVSEGD